METEIEKGVSDVSAAGVDKKNTKKKNGLGFFQRLGLLYTFAAGGLICITGVAINTTNQLVRTDQQVIHTYQVLSQFELVSSQLKDVERGQRGYLLTRDEKFLAPYESSVDDVYRSIDRLEGLISDNPSQIANVESLRFFADERVILIKRSLQLTQGGNFDGAIALVASGEGERAMAQVQEIVDRAKREEEQLLAIRLESSRVAVRVQWFATGALFSFVAMILCGAYLVVNREIEQRLLAEADALAARDEAAGEREKLMYVMREDVPLMKVQDGIRRGDDMKDLFNEIDRLIAEINDKG